MILYLLLGIYMFLFLVRNKIETRMTFTGMGKLLGKIPDAFENILLKDQSGNIIHGIYFDNKSEKTIFYFHGNSGPISSYLEEITQLTNLGYNIISYDYPGYGKSTGFPSEQNIYNSTQLFFEHIRDKMGIQSEDLIIFGHSIGSGVGVEFAFRNNVEKIILLSPLSSKYAVSKSRYKIVLQKLLFMKNGFDTLSKIQHITTPILIIHGNIDRVISFDQGESIFRNSASLSKFLVILNNFGHAGIFRSFKSQLNPLYKEFLEKGALPQIVTTLHH